MTREQAKLRAAELYDQGKWLQLAILIAQFGIELIQYLRERLKKKKDDTQTTPQNDPAGTDDPVGQNLP